MTSRIKIKPLLLSFAIVYLVAFVGSIATSANTNSEWYASIRPEITPPNFVFPIVWNILFFLIALSLYFIITAPPNKQKKKAYTFFALNLALNAGWSFLYFGLRNPSLAFLEIIFLWLTLIGMIYFSQKIEKKAAYLLIPYFLWVSFAVLLNYLSI